MAKKKAKSASKKPASKPAPTPRSTPAQATSSSPKPTDAREATTKKIVKKAAPKAVKTASKPAKPAATKSKAATASKTTPKTASRPATKATAKHADGRADRATRPAAASVEASGRPASKPHVHPAGGEPQALPGRARKESSGPVHGGIGDAAVRNATGRGWDEWFALLDGAGAAAMDHAAIAALLEEKHEVAAWWAQSITVGYEQARGLRQKYQAADGFQAGVSKTINAATAKLYHAWEDEASRVRWMGDHKVEIRVANTDKNIRMTWLVQGPDEGSSVEVNFWPKDANKCLVQVQQRKLADAEAVRRARAFWSVKLENLRAAMEKA